MNRKEFMERLEVLLAGIPAGERRGNPVLYRLF